MLFEESETIRNGTVFCGKDEFSLRCFEFDALIGKCSIDRFMNPELRKDLA